MTLLITRDQLLWHVIIVASALLMLCLAYFDITSLKMSVVMALILSTIAVVLGSQRFAKQIIAANGQQSRGMASSSSAQPTDSAIQEPMKSAIFDSSLDALITIDTEGKIIEFSPSAVLTFGWSKEEITGLTLEQTIIPPEMRQQHQRGLKHFHHTGKGPLMGGRIETEAMTKNGHRFPVELSLISTTVNDVCYVTATIRDISERKENERQMMIAKEQAVAASMAKSRFLSYMSHEIRSPLNAVLGSLNLLTQRPMAADGHFVTMAQTAGESLLVVINDILDFSQLEAGYVTVQASTVEVVPLVKNVLVGFGLKSDGLPVELLCHVDAKVPLTVMLDRVKVRQILHILLDNALNSTTFGTITVKVTRSKMFEGQQGLRFSISDTGAGIEQDQQHSVFSEFSQVDATLTTGYGGAALGLVIAKSMVSVMKGHIGLKSLPGQGSTFFFDVPVSWQEPQRQAVDYRYLSCSGAIVLLSANAYLIREMRKILMPYADWVRSYTSIEELINDRPVYEQLKVWQSRLVFDGDAFVPGSQLTQLFAALGCVKIRLMAANKLADNATLFADEQVLLKPIIDEELYQMLDGSMECADAATPAIKSKQLLSGELLLVEDVEFNRVIATQLLQQRGFVVTVAVDGVEAVEIAQTKRFDVILMDVRMPRLNGLEATKQIRVAGQLNRDVPIIAFTANTEISEISRCKEVGMNAFVSKPYSETQLVETIVKVINEHCDIEEPPLMTANNQPGLLLRRAPLAPLAQEPSTGYLSTGYLSTGIATVRKIILTPDTDLSDQLDPLGQQDPLDQQDTLDLQEPLDQQDQQDPPIEAQQEDIEPMVKQEQLVAVLTKLSQAEVINVSTLEGLVRDTSLRSFPDIISMFYTELDNRSAAMSNCFESHNLIQVREEAHALKGCSGTFGATQVYLVAQAIEASAKNSHVVEIGKLLEHMIEIINETKKQYGQYFSGLLSDEQNKPKIILQNPAVQLN